MISAVLNGCAYKTAIVGGPNDMLVLPAGTIIKDVPLPTADGQPHDVKTAKLGYWISQPGFNRIEKVTTGSNPKEAVQ